MAGLLLELTEQAELEGVRAGPIIHLHLLADLIVLERVCFCPILIDFSHRIKGNGGKVCNIAVCIGLGDQIAVTIVDIGGAVAKPVGLARNEVAAIILVESGFVEPISGEYEINKDSIMQFAVCKGGLEKYDNTKDLVMGSNLVG